MEYNYLFSASPTELTEDTAQEDLARMIEDMKELPYEMDDVLDELLDLQDIVKDYITEAEDVLRYIMPVMRAFEYWKSGEWTEDQFRQVLAKYRE